MSVLDREVDENSALTGFSTGSPSFGEILEKEFVRGHLHWRGLKKKG
jgi:hypothetical protein